MALGGKKFGFAKSLYNGSSVIDRLNIIGLTNLTVGSFMIGKAVKGWVQLSNQQKRELIKVYDDMGALD